MQEKVHRIFFKDILLNVLDKRAKKCQEEEGTVALCFNSKHAMNIIR